MSGFGGCLTRRMWICQPCMMDRGKGSNSKDQLPLHWVMDPGPSGQQNLLKIFAWASCNIMQLGDEASFDIYPAESGNCPLFWIHASNKSCQFHSCCFTLNKTTRKQSEQTTWLVLIMIIHFYFLDIYAIVVNCWNWKSVPEYNT